MCGIGFVAHLRGERSHDVVRHALDMLVHLAHRGATGSDAETGDGAGILVQLPHALLRQESHIAGISLPDAGAYGVGMVFLPHDATERAAAVAVVEATIAKHGCRILGWRDVPVAPEQLAPAAFRTRPAIAQVIVAPAPYVREVDDGSGFERTLYVIRRSIERAAPRALYVASLSSRTIVYKGLLRPDQLSSFYTDLAHPAFASGLAIVHSRFSTNTAPSWALAHPYRYLCHNGEINTLRGNLAWMRAREGTMASPHFADMRELLPVTQSDQSDSASLDNVLELLVQAGRPIGHAIQMLVPEAWERHETMSAARRAFYAYHASLMEPWDGPAALAFTDGRQIGAMLDRNGLRPARWMVTDSDLVVLASEAGAFRIAPERLREHGRLRPGQLLLVNTTQGRVLHDDEIKSELASRHPYRRWVDEHRVELPAASAAEVIAGESHARMQRAFGYTREEVSVVLEPMSRTGEEPVGSMGNDTPLAVLSQQPQLLSSYFRQLFAQVTNPAIDPLRESLVMSLTTRLGPQRNLLDETPEHAHQVQLEHPVLTAASIAALRSIGDPALRAATLPALFAVDAPGRLGEAVERLCASAAEHVRAGCGILILSDRGIDVHHAPIPSLLAVSAVHHHLIRDGCRTPVSLVAEAGDAREVSQVALLFSYGASAVYPYLALASVSSPANYVKALEKGLLKILSKMGISTLQSYIGAQLWEAIGLDRALIEAYFTGTSSQLAGIGLSVVAEDVLRWHASAFAASDTPLLDAGGEYQYRSRGERHAWNPETIVALQRASRENALDRYREFSRLVNDPESGELTIRSLLDFADRESVALADVEPASAIVRRFVTGAMSFGSLSSEAHETLAVAMNRLGGRSNTGEGGEDRARFGTERNSAIKQVASARFGVTAEYLVSASELQIKIAQGAKPGEGGQLPGYKVDEAIARTRHATPGVTLISPPPHHDIYSIEDLKQLIYDLRNVNPSATISVKLVAEAGVGTVAAGVAKAGADLITISGDSGGTGASPLSSIKRAGIPWELGLADAHRTLIRHGLRQHATLQVDGQLKTGRDVAIAALLGAEEFGFATAPLIVEGCVMMRKCHLNTCPVGIATQDPVLRAKFAGRPEHIVNYLFFVAEELRELMARLGFRMVSEMVGRADVLRRRPTAPHAKAAAIDLAALLQVGEDAPQRMTARAPRAPSSTLDAELISQLEPALAGEATARLERFIENHHRSVGAMISGEIARRHGAVGLPDDAIVIHLKGTAGQSFGAFATRGLTLDLEGQANDYVAKGLCGGCVIVRPPKLATVPREGAVIIGNTVLYGATSGDLFVAGAAGERFAVRNSGATAVVEGVGDHGCEYMTGGLVVVLGGVGRNFGAGMSGGIAYVLDASKTFRERVTSPLLEVAPVAELPNQLEAYRLIERHVRATGSRRGRHLLSHWSETLHDLVRVMPLEYKQALERGDEAHAAGDARHG